jgi:hypothetical protein
MVLKKANETPLELEGNLLKVSALSGPTHYSGILLAKNLSLKMSEERFNELCIEATKYEEVFNVVPGKDGKAIVILKNGRGTVFLLRTDWSVFIQNLYSCNVYKE